MSVTVFISWTWSCTLCLLISFTQLTPVTASGICYNVPRTRLPYFDTLGLSVNFTLQVDNPACYRCLVRANLVLNTKLSSDRKDERFRLRNGGSDTETDERTLVLVIPFVPSSSSLDSTSKHPESVIYITGTELLKQIKMGLSDPSLTKMEKQGCTASPSVTPEGDRSGYLMGFIPWLVGVSYLWFMVPFITILTLVAVNMVWKYYDAELKEKGSEYIFISTGSSRPSSPVHGLQHSRLGSLDSGAMGDGSLAMARRLYSTDSGFKSSRCSSGSSPNSSVFTR